MVKFVMIILLELDAPPEDNVNVQHYIPSL
jgi:hypothetical protein